jgi:type IV secretory pathway VirB6-like protein
MHLGLGAIWLTVADTGAYYKFYSSTDNSGFYSCQSRKFCKIQIKLLFHHIEDIMTLALAFFTTLVTVYAMCALYALCMILGCNNL